MIGDNEVPLLGIQSSAQSRRSIYTLVRSIIAAASQLQQKQGGVVFRIFNQQDSKRSTHLSSPYGRSLVQIQPIQAKLASSVLELGIVNRLAYVTICYLPVSVVSVRLFD